MKQIFALLVLTLILYDCSTHLSHQNDEEKRNQIRMLKDKLTGIWASREYEKLLNSTNSMTEAKKFIKTYTDIIFGGDSILYCNKPDFMEAHYLYLNSDSTVKTYVGELRFKIQRVNDSVFSILLPDGDVYHFIKIDDQVNQDNIYLNVNNGSQALKYSWFAGRYQFVTDTLDTTMRFNKDGTITGNQDFLSYSLDSYLQTDLIDIEIAPDHVISFRINVTNGTTFELEKIEEILEMDAPIEPRGIFATLIRK